MHFTKSEIRPLTSFAQHLRVQNWAIELKSEPNTYVVSSSVSYAWSSAVFRTVILMSNVESTGPTYFNSIQNGLGLILQWKIVLDSVENSELFAWIWFDKKIVNDSSNRFSKKGWSSQLDETMFIYCLFKLWITVKVVIALYVTTISICKLIRENDSFIIFILVRSSFIRLGKFCSTCSCLSDYKG